MRRPDPHEELLTGVLTGLKFCAFLTAALICLLWLTTGVSPWAALGW